MRFNVNLCARSRGPRGTPGTRNRYFRCDHPTAIERHSRESEAAMSMRTILEFPDPRLRTRASARDPLRRRARPASSMTCSRPCTPRPGSASRRRRSTCTSAAGHRRVGRAQRAPDAHQSGDPRPRGARSPRRRAASPFPAIYEEVKRAAQDPRARPGSRRQGLRARLRGDSRRVRPARDGSPRRQAVRRLPLQPRSASASARSSKRNVRSARPAPPAAASAAAVLLAGTASAAQAVPWPAANGVGPLKAPLGGFKNAHSLRRHAGVCGADAALAAALAAPARRRADAARSPARPRAAPAASPSKAALDHVDAGGAARALRSDEDRAELRRLAARCARRRGVWAHSAAGRSRRSRGWAA